MIFTSYCGKKPFKSDLSKAWQSMTVMDQVYMEDALQRWQPKGPETAHVYTDIDANRRILARKVVDVDRFLVAVQDTSRNEIVVVSMDRGNIQSVIVTAFDYAGIPRQSLSPNINWTG